MRDSKFRPILSVVTLVSLMLTATVAHAGSIRTSDVVQVVNSNPTRQTGTATQLLVSPNGATDNPNAPAGQQDDPRVITEEVTDIVEEGPCNCPDFKTEPFVATGGGFPWYLLGLGGIPFIGLCCGGDDDPSPSPSLPMTPTTPTPNTPMTPTPTTPTPTTPTPTPNTPTTPSPSPSGSKPPMTPTPKITPSGTPPNTVPEPMTILLFGTGLSGIGFAARRLMRKRRENDESEEQD